MKNEAGSNTETVLILPTTMLLIYLIPILREIFAVFLTLTYTFGQQILYLPVHRPEIILRPGSNGLIQLRREPEEKLLFGVIVHISKDYLSLLSAARHGFRTARQEDLIPLRPCVHRPAQAFFLPQDG